MISPSGARGIALSAVFMALNSLFIGIRCYTKARISRNFNYNDMGMIMVVVAYASLMALFILGVTNGIGSSTFTVGIAAIGRTLKYIWFLEFIYVILTSIMKASVAMTLLQWTKSRIHFYILWTAITLDALICTAFVLYLLLQCQPISYAWTFVDQTVKGHCAPFVGQLYMGYALCITTITIDMLILFLPFFMMRGRGLNSRLKMYIYGIFFLGVLASFANFIRLGALVRLKSSQDQLVDALPVFNWSVIEVSIGICVAGMLELGPLMQRFNVKGFENHGAFDRFDDDTEPLKLQSISKPFGVVTTTDI